MNKIVATSMLLFFTGLESSENGKRILEDISQVQTVGQKQRKIKTDPRVFHFKSIAPRKVPLRIGSFEERQKSMQGPIDQPTNLLKFNRQEMQIKMQSVTHCLKGDALKYRIDNINSDLVNIYNPEVKNLVMFIADARIDFSSSPQENFKFRTPKTARNLLNSLSLASYEKESLIVQEPYADAVIVLLEGELKGVEKNLEELFLLQDNKNRFFTISSNLGNKSRAYRFAVKNPEAISSLVCNYMEIKDDFACMQSQTAESRDLFNQLEKLQQRVICDDFVTKESLIASHNKMIASYTKIKSTLSPQSHEWMIKSFNGLEKSIKEFEEN